MDHLALEHPRFSPTNRSSDDLDREGAMSAAALPLASVGAPGPPAWPPAGEGTLPGMRSRSKQESMNARLAAGEHPWDMISLKAAIQAAQPGPARDSAWHFFPALSCGAVGSCRAGKTDLEHTQTCLILTALRQLHGMQGLGKSPA